MRLLLIPLAAAALVVAGCGSSSSNTSSNSGGASTPANTTPAPAAAGGHAVAVSADGSGQLKFDKSSLSAKAGKVTIVMNNPSSSGISHGIAVQGNGVDKDGPTVSPGSRSTVTVTLKPGTYTFYCPVDGHRAAGMQGKLVVS